ncbi:low-affinity glucose transporter HXT3 [Arthroderma uncinatum]|uniref:low-affinity glucose transporter HXT3 n=1 Tax=Arthroderma uncinatum TaxID=74035 RepID=UPI00144A84E4|nr:low-affinity glucose transporter HXT3 [Arthroderma uncinatum]KAF3481382.1 low-affinity glucose transporter HXT3 [Arthroderma uncinatum]
MGVASGSDRDAAAIGGLIGCVWGILGAILLATAQNIAWFAFARVISGIGCGYLNTIVPVWTSELAPANMRGAFVAVQFTLAMVGSAMVYWAEYACVKTQSLSFAWRFPNAFQVVFLIALLIFGPFYPESPRYLAKIGKVDQAKAILEQCRTTSDPAMIQTEMDEILDAIQIESTVSNASFYSMLFTNDKLHTRRRVFLGAGVQIMQKFTGIDFIAVYAPNIFAFSGFKGDTPALLAETANRHLEDLDLLFASKSNLVWRAEKEFAEAKAS